MASAKRAHAAASISTALLSIACVCNIACAEEVTPRELLTRMDTALRTLDFQGSFIYLHDGRVDALRIFHLGGERGRERLVSLTGPRGEIVRDDDAVTCVPSGSMPALFARRADLRLLPLLPDLNAIGAQYSIKTNGDDRIAGYAARIVDIEPRDPYRYGYRLWLARDSELPLGSALLDASSRPLEKFMFVALEVGAKPNETDLRASEAPPEPPELNDGTAAAAASSWHLGAAPAGFRLVRSERADGAAPKAEHLIYSDGVATVSVYVEPRAEAAAATSTVVHGALSIASRSDGELRITALGDVPPATVQAMAGDVRPREVR